jgi:hypothetical protein
MVENKVDKPKTSVSPAVSVAEAMVLAAAVAQAGRPECIRSL